MAKKHVFSDVISCSLSKVTLGKVSFTAGVLQDAAGLVVGNTVLQLSEMHESRTTVSREPYITWRQDLHSYIGKDLYISLINASVTGLISSWGVKHKKIPHSDH